MVRVGEREGVRERAVWLVWLAMAGAIAPARLLVACAVAFVPCACEETERQRC